MIGFIWSDSHGNETGGDLEAYYRHVEGDMTRERAERIIAQWNAAAKQWGLQDTYRLVKDSWTPRIGIHGNEQFDTFDGFNGFNGFND